MTSKITDILIEAADHYSVKQISDGEITKIRFAEKCRVMTIFTEFCEYVDRELIYKAEHDIRESNGSGAGMIKPRLQQ